MNRTDAAQSLIYLQGSFALPGHLSQKATCSDAALRGLSPIVDAITYGLIEARD